MNEDTDQNSGASGGIDTELVRRLADILGETNLTCIEVERAGLRIRVAREGLAQSVVYAAPPAPAPVPSASAASASAASEASATATQARRDTDLVKSPMVGTVYLQPQPGAAPFAKVGDTVAAGQTLFVIEAMKTMNPVPAVKAGKVVEILVGDAQPVEFGQPLAVVA